MLSLCARSKSVLRSRRLKKWNTNHVSIRSYAIKDVKPIEKLRNIGISAHIDSGKTTLTERILFYTGKIREIHEVRGKDGVGAKMDNMELEREKGITIKSAATFVDWDDININIIDTPGHVDFTMEVERSLKVLDGAVLVLCGASGVQSQTMTVDRQMKRYNVPRLVFVNKLDRLGADPWKALKGLREKLNLNVATVQLPIGLHTNHNGVVDIIEQRAIYFEGDKGEKIVYKEVPKAMVREMAEKRAELIDVLSGVNDGLLMKVMEGEEPSVEEIKQAIKEGVRDLTFTPMFMGSAYKNKGVQPLLDGVRDYLPNPYERNTQAYDEKNELYDVDPKDLSKPTLAYAFKIEDNRFGQLTWIRVYQGIIKKGAQIFNANVGSKAKVPRLAKMHAGDLEDINEIKAGDICALFGVDCASGETFTTGSKHLMTNMHVPDPVISLSIQVKSKNQVGAFTKALTKYQREDPTFRVTQDQETHETLIAGMGELHLEVYVERMKREEGVSAIIGKPRVAFRETILSEAPIDFTHKKQTGGAGQYARIIGRLEPVPEDEIDPNMKNGNEFVNNMFGSAIPPNYIPAIEKGFDDVKMKGPLIEHPIQNVRFVLESGDFHAVDSSEFAFRLCTQYAFTKAFREASPTLLQPIMSVQIQFPSSFQSEVNASVLKRKGTIDNASLEGQIIIMDCQVPLANMFGYATELRSMTEGKGEFSMEYQQHDYVTNEDLNRILAKYEQEKQSKKTVGI
eukprot:TRINITY_DN5130_c0_g1_i1.p1 TRINITY_DN5130_c0_g1~~TRINITY_DN5130_c0_g1_i1.p1  ORF type:complete len:739 (-),score=201.34 TRINITY_DN5130_c0_g1_i1:43-2259(-)